MYVYIWGTPHWCQSSASPRRRRSSLAITSVVAAATACHLPSAVTSGLDAHPSWPTEVSSSLSSERVCIRAFLHSREYIVGRFPYPYVQRFNESNNRWQFYMRAQPFGGCQYDVKRSFAPHAANGCDALFVLLSLSSPPTCLVD